MPSRNRLVEDGSARCEGMIRKNICTVVQSSITKVPNSKTCFRNSFCAQSTGYDMGGTTRILGYIATRNGDNTDTRHKNQISYTEGGRWERGQQIILDNTAHKTRNKRSEVQTGETIKNNHQHPSPRTNSAIARGDCFVAAEPVVVGTRTVKWPRLEPTRSVQMTGKNPPS